MTVSDANSGLADMQARAARFAERVERIRGKGTRLNGRLVFEVDVRKYPLRVAVDSGVEQYNADSIAEMFQGAARDACRDVDRQIQEALGEFGDDQKTRDLVKDLMGPLSPQVPSAAQSPERQAAPEDDDESWNDARSWMERA